MIEDTHKLRCEQECTRDVIFLLRVKSFHAYGGWKTEGVFLDRDEAEKWATDRQHNYGKKGDDWHVYGFCAEGILAEILQTNPAHNILLKLGEVKS